jgi:hexosaminidase
MKKTIWSLSLASLLAVVSCQSPEPTLEEAGIIPYPASLEARAGSFKLDSDAAVKLVGESADLQNLGEYLASRIRPATGFEIPISSESGNLILELKSGGNADSYDLDISETEVKISAGSSSGLFYGIQTLLQIFPVEIEKKSLVEMSWKLPQGKILDQPEYEYRGSMLDVARHFISVEDVKHYIDQMAGLKLNYLHLHLTDDQGWRIEIKSWPKLTEIGGSTQVGGGKGGFYTQEEYKEIVAYAAQNFITIVPEVDMPGHTNSALASYAELNPGVNLPNGKLDSLNKSPLDYQMPLKNPQAAELYTGIEVGFSTFATDLELTYQFVEDVVREISALTPGPYFHIGGDESHVTEKEDYIYFIERVQDIVVKYGKTNIGWDEVATAKLVSGSIAQFWAVEENAKLAKKQGNKVLMSPSKKVYLDMQYDSTTRIGLHWAAYIELDSAYLWSPETYADSLERVDILGVEAPLWTETVTNRADLEYLVFPRLSAIAEVAWTKTERKDWESFKKRIAIQGKRWDINGIGFYRSPKVNW